ncbi:MAG TPA: N(4)-(beta-N-acetylglucosaminyl)-L-asparaginase [Bryobacteraceae bacterium]|nr:N(4)-(beta-N-acetylglucosaminyl)-L-asparaginase [Bryobacteraceae bacterium]
MITRRQWMAGTALAGAGAAAPSANSKNVVISSANGLRACERAMEMIQSGSDTLDAVVAGVNIVELDPADHSVGYGGLPNEDGVVELDACVMHGPSRRCGAVGAIRNIKTPSRVAKLVMEQTDHVMLVGDGALRFAKDWGFKEEDLLTEESRLAWLVWKQSLRDKSGHNNWINTLRPGKPSAELRRMFPDAEESTLAWAAQMALRPPTGTINCLGLNRKGEISGVTTTSGLAWKIPGRVGDSPIIGAGLFVDQDVGAAGSTGVGEENIRISGGHTSVENMRHGMTPQAACLDALRRVARNFDNDRTRLEKIDINFYALRKDGVYGAAALWRRPKHPAQFSVNQGGSSHLEPCAYLLDG